MYKKLSMNGYLKKSIVTVCLLSGMQLAIAQTQPTTLTDLLKSALSGSYTVQVSELEEENTERKIQETRSRTLPQINGSGNITDNYKRQVLVLPPELSGGTESTPITVGTKYSSAIGVEATQPLFDMSAFTGLKASKAAREYALIATRKTKEDLINSVAQQYYQIQVSMEELKLQQQTIAILAKLIEASEGQYANGLLRKIDLDRIRVSLINSQSRLTQAQNDVAVKTNQLKVSMGMPLAAPLVLDTLVLSDQSIALAETETNMMFSATVRTEVNLINSEIRLNTLQRNAIRAENYPKLSAFFNYNHNVVSNEFGSMFNGQDPSITYGMGSLGVRLQVPIFSGFARTSRVAQSNIRIKQLEKQREAKVLELDASHKSAGIQMTNTLSTLRAQQQNVKLSEDVYEATRANYSLGLSSLTDLLDSQTSFLEAKNIYTKSLLNYKLAELEMMRADGTLLKLVE